jgi:poly(ADP-ribose) glycohydrolase ARH3
MVRLSEIEGIATSTLDRIRGCILGAVIGDAFGAPLEGASPAGLGSLVERRMLGREPWGYTDDSAMLIATAESLSAAGTIEPVSLLRALDARYEPARGFGRGMKMALAAFRSGTPWEQCARAAWPEGSRGNGAAVRIAPVALARWPTREAFASAVAIATRVTHAHPDALAFARFQASAIAIILEAPSLLSDPPAFHGELVARLAPMPPLLAAKLDAIFDLVAHARPRSDAARVLGTSTLASESVAVALWSFVSAHASFTDAITGAALLGGDVDSICCLVGALAGALFGAEAIVGHWSAHLGHERPTKEELVALADSLHSLLPRPPRRPDAT